jgi:Uma2 family endonuclease
MNIALQKPWTQEQFFEWAQGQDGRYEFDGFQPVAMTGGTLGHSRVTGNLHFSLRSRLRGGPCEPLGPDAGVQTVGRTIRYPDALVSCSKTSNDAYLIENVVVVFEVASPSPNSIRTDRVIKVREYAAVPSIRRYVIVESSSIGLVVHERSHGDDPWTVSTLINRDDILKMPEIGIEIPVAEIYADITFPEAQPDS